MRYLGNNRLVADASGAILQTNHYDPYGWRYDGARHYAPSIRRRLTPDPLSEKYYSISPYAYCAGNPVNLVDPNGMYFLDEQDEKKARKIERQLKRKAYRYARKANRLKGKPSAKYDEYSQRANELFLSMRDIQDMRDNEKMAFHFEEYNSESQQEYGLETPETRIFGTDDKGNPIVVMFSEQEQGNIIHELRHGGQYARGEVRLSKLVDNEISAFRAQFAWYGTLSYSSGELFEQNHTDKDERILSIVQQKIDQRTIKSIQQINRQFLFDIVRPKGVELVYQYRY